MYLFQQSSAVIRDELCYVHLCQRNVQFVSSPSTTTHARFSCSFLIVHPLTLLMFGRTGWRWISGVQYRMLQLGLVVLCWLYLELK
jgi:hypothetical protein